MKIPTSSDLKDKYGGKKEISIFPWLVVLG